MSADPRETLNASSMSRLQLIVIAITVALNALDGFDVLSISFRFARHRGRMAHQSRRLWASCCRWS